MSIHDRSAEISQWKELISPGPDVILLAVRCDVRYTAEEHAIYKQLKKAWGNDAAFCERLVLAFTFGDRQDEDLETELKTVCPELQSVLKDARHRYVLFNNLASKEERKSMATKLFEIFTTGARSIPRARVRKATGHAGDGPEPKVSAEGFYGDTKARGDANVQPVMDRQQGTGFRCTLV